MRLSKIKLSGFKSFADPTVLKLTGNPIGIVGPNGCGKSNIIDAVLWVMGESSARYLRGDALTDVIFNGSRQRKPVGQASVELIFDNTEKKQGERYITYDEISIKRQINRDRISVYFFNGVRCRRRDITEIFLGTGLGPRNYAIIKQDMISRLIEANPEELRLFIEEAAGISKYRERRHETALSIKKSNENINRINDILDELNKQTKNLKRQVGVAEQFRSLKQEGRQLKAECLALGWRELQEVVEQKEVQLAKQKNVVESNMAKLRAIEAELEGKKVALNQANHCLNQIQSDYYSAGSAISRIEQQIQHTNEKEAALRQDLQRIDTYIEQITSQYMQDKAQQKAADEELTELKPRLQEAQLSSEQAQQLLNEAESKMQHWQAEWDVFSQSQADSDRRHQLDQARLEYLESGMGEIDHRRKQLEDRIDQLKGCDLELQHEQLHTQLEARQSELKLLQATYEASCETAQKGRNIVHTLTTQLGETHAEQQLLEAKSASLEELQKSHLAGHCQQLDIWLQQNEAMDLLRLVERVEVDPKWVKALEMVAGLHLYHFCTDRLDLLLDKLGDAAINVGFVAAGNSARSQGKWPRLVDQIKNEVVLPSVLESIYIADELGAALSMRTELAAHESVVTVDGFWLGTNWLVANRVDQKGGGALSQRQKISALQVRLQEMNAQALSLEEELNINQNRLEQVEKEQHENQQRMQQLQSKIAEGCRDLAVIEAKITERTSHKQQIENELKLLQQRTGQERQEVQQLTQRLSGMTEHRGELDARFRELTTLQEQYRTSLEAARANWQNTYEENHNMALQFESLNSRRGLLEQAIKRNEVQLHDLRLRYKESESKATDCRAPLSALKATLEKKLEEKVVLEERLAGARERVQQIESNIRVQEQDHSQCEQRIQALHNELEDIKIQLNEHVVRAKTITEQLQESGHDVTELLAALDVSEKQADRQAKLDNIARKIQQLGPVNLAAIDEFNQLLERKAYLDSQHADLNKALLTLEGAIAKIDKETRTRFKETFDLLNHNLRKLFPQLFGGGDAYLELTESNLLKTGVTIMGRPPGKRNSTIHLLSGGEKALTAVALVFSIFQLKPAPFCILDEVDAPLDDANTVRFGKLVQSMSNEVQFIFITHNKITMEIAQQLLGVTMQEAGVSRFVSVDMERAVQLAATG